MDSKESNLCYGLDVSNDHDEGVITFKFLDTDKTIHLNQLELSIFANYILDQYSSTPKALSNIDMLENINNRIDLMQLYLASQIHNIGGRITINESELLNKIDQVVTVEDLESLKSDYSNITSGILNR